MIKNIILDVGGILFDDSKENIRKIVGNDYEEIYKAAYSGGFKDCLLGTKTLIELIEELKDNMYYEKLKYILSEENLNVSYPILKENFEYIKTLKDSGYNLYLLTNINKETHKYINGIIDIDKYFKGGIYSYKEGIKKPNPNIYDLLINRFGLKKEECVFFDDRKRNVDAANEIGIKAILFKTIDDIKNNIG